MGPCHRQLSSASLIGAPLGPCPQGKARRVVTWAVPVGTHTLLGGASIGGLAWLLGVRRQSDALAIVLRRAMAIDAEVDE